MKQNEIRQEYLTGERALFMSKDLAVFDSVFADGESPLKESENIELYDSLFRWKYPLWYCNHVRAERCTWFDMARAGVWYTNDISVTDTIIEAPKNFRRCDGVKLKHVNFVNAEETLWNCKNIEMTDVQARGDYFAMNCENIEIQNFELVGNYSFDGVKHMTMKNAKLLSKDAFWNTDQVTVYITINAGYEGTRAKLGDNYSINGFNIGVGYRF